MIRMGQQQQRPIMMFHGWWWWLLFMWIYYYYYNDDHGIVVQTVHAIDSSNNMNSNNNNNNKIQQLNIVPSSSYIMDKVLLSWKNDPTRRQRQLFQNEGEDNDNDNDVTSEMESMIRQEWLSMIQQRYDSSSSNSNNNNNQRRRRITWNNTTTNITTTTSSSNISWTTNNNNIYSPFHEWTLSELVSSYHSIHPPSSTNNSSSNSSMMWNVMLEWMELHNQHVKQWEDERQLSRHERSYRHHHQQQQEQKEMVRRRRRRLGGDDEDAGMIMMQQGQQQQSHQYVPLSQGYGTHYVTVWVGSPTPQRKSVIVDTGSHYTAFPCKGCDNCGEEYHTDQYFDYDMSSSFHALTCKECKNGGGGSGGSAASNARCVKKDNRCVFTQSYTEGSSWVAFQAKDLFFCGGTDVLDAADPMDRQFAIPFLFGCQMEESGLFVTQLADGIMGLSEHAATFPQQLYKEKKIQHNIFSLCFRQEMVVSKKGITAGVMTLGGYDPTLHIHPVRYAKNVAARAGGWYTIYVKNVFLRTFKTNSYNHQHGSSNNNNNEEEDVLMRIPLQRGELNSGKGIIVDSGTTDTYLHQSIHHVFAHAWKEVTGTAYSNSPIRLSQDDLNLLPTILIQIKADAKSHNNNNNNSQEQQQQQQNQQDNNNMNMMMEDHNLLIHRLDPDSPQDIILAIPATHYMEYSPSKDLFTSRLYFTESKGGVIGANAMQGHDVIFDYQNSRVGFAQSYCKKVFPRDIPQSLHSNNNNNLNYNNFNNPIPQQQQQQASPLPNMIHSNPNNAFPTTSSASSIIANNGGNSYNPFDCRLETPVLVTSCLDTVNVETCALQPEMTLVGTETWSTTIQYLGKQQNNQPNNNNNNQDDYNNNAADTTTTTTNNNNNNPFTQPFFDDGDTKGLSCEQVLSLSSHSTNGLEVTCDASLGLCWKTQPCHISCSQDQHIWKQPKPTPLPRSSNNNNNNQQQQQQVVVNNNNNNNNYGRCLVDWSVCTYACLQSRIYGQLFSDGTCHEERREQRICHTDECANNHPCRVPFKLHTIFVLSGVQPHQWTATSRQIFTKAFTNSIHAFHSTTNTDYNNNNNNNDNTNTPMESEQQQQQVLPINNALNYDKEVLFREGDVKILTPLPWIKGNNKEDDEEKNHDPNSSSEQVPTNDSGGDVAGVKLVLEVSMFNPLYNDEMKYNTMGVSNSKKRKKKNHMECKESDFYPLARLAHDIHKLLEEPIFKDELIKQINTIHHLEHKEDPFFLPITTSHRNQEESEVIASWTIKTDSDGGGKIHDHALDPLLGKLDYIFVITYYLSTIPSIVSILLGIVIVYLHLMKGNHRSHFDEHHDEQSSSSKQKEMRHSNSSNSLSSKRTKYARQANHGIHCPNPFNVAHRKLVRSYYKFTGYDPKKKKYNSNNSVATTPEQQQEQQRLLYDPNSQHHNHDDDDDDSFVMNNEGGGTMFQLKRSISKKNLYRLNSFQDLESRTRTLGIKHQQLQRNITLMKDKKIKPSPLSSEMMHYKSKLDSIIRN